MSHTTSTSTETTQLLPSSKLYTKSGIGGAGNYQQISSLSSSLPLSIPKSSKGQFSSGIGGAGNIHTYSERASISSLDELDRRAMRKQSVAGSYHHGIGGAGNRSSMESLSSDADSLSGADRIKGRVVGYFAGTRSSGEKEGRESWSS